MVGFGSIKLNMNSCNVYKVCRKHVVFDEISNFSNNYLFINYRKIVKSLWQHFTFNEILVVIYIKNFFNWMEIY